MIDEAVQRNVDSLLKDISPDADKSELFKLAHALVLDRQYYRAMSILKELCVADRTSVFGNFLLSVACFAADDIDSARRHADMAEVLDQKFGPGTVPPLMTRFRPMILESERRIADQQLQPEIMEALRLDIYHMPYINWLTEPHVRGETIATDGYGFRHTVGPSGDVFSVSDFSGSEYWAFFGASAAFGAGSTGNDKTVPSRLSAYRGGQPWLNFAIPASVLEFNLIGALFLRPMRARPRAFVLFAGCNELSIPLSSSLSMPPLGVAGNVALMLRVMNGSYDEWVSKLGLPLVDNTPYRDRDIGQLCERIETLLTKTLRNFSYLAAGCGAPLYYVLQPNAHWMTRRKPSESEIAWFEKLQNDPRNGYATISDLFTDLFPWYHEMVRRACAASNIPFFDCNAALDLAEHSGKTLFMDRVHLTDEGYDLAARFITETVLK